MPPQLQPLAPPLRLCVRPLRNGWCLLGYDSLPISATRSALTLPSTPKWEGTQQTSKLSPDLSRSQRICSHKFSCPTTACNAPPLWGPIQNALIDAQRIKDYNEAFPRSALQQRMHHAP